MDDIILRYLNETATDQEMRTLLEWLDQSDENQKYFFGIRDLWLASGASYPNATEDVEAFARFKEKALIYEKRNQKKQFTISLLKVAASVAVFLVCSVGSYFAGQHNVIPEQITILMNQYITGEGNKASVTLPDGTIAWLNSNSRLTYPDKFDADFRKVKLEGEGYFEVTHNEKAPFYVEVKDMSIKVLGTHFDVQSYDRKEISETILLSGKVEVSLANNKNIILEPNQKLSFNKKAGQYKVENVNASEYILWKNERLIFDNETLATILNKMEHWYGIDISYGKDIPLKSKYSLVIRNESKEEILKMLSIIAPVNYTIKNDNVILSRK